MDYVRLLENSQRSEELQAVDISDGSLIRPSFGFSYQKQGKWQTYCLPLSIKNSASILGQDLEEEAFEEMKRHAEIKNGTNYELCADVLRRRSRNLSLIISSKEDIKFEFERDSDAEEHIPQIPYGQNQTVDIGVSRLGIARMIHESLNNSFSLVASVDVERMYRGTTFRHPHSIQRHAISLIGYEAKDGFLSIQVIDPTEGVGMYAVPYDRLFKSLVCIPAVVCTRLPIYLNRVLLFDRNKKI